MPNKETLAALLKAQKSNDIAGIVYYQTKAEKELQDELRKKGILSNVIVNGGNLLPEVEVTEKAGSLKWLWILLGIVALLLLIFFLLKSKNNGKKTII